MVQVNPKVVGLLEEGGLQFVGRDESGNRMEVCFWTRPFTTFHYSLNFLDRSWLPFSFFGANCHFSTVIIITFNRPLTDSRASWSSILCGRTVPSRI